VHTPHLQPKILHRPLLTLTPKRPPRLPRLPRLPTLAALESTLAPSTTIAETRPTITSPLRKPRSPTSAKSTSTAAATPLVLQLHLRQLFSTEQLTPTLRHHRQCTQNRLRLQLRTLTLELLHYRLQRLPLRILQSPHDRFVKGRDPLLVHRPIRRHRHRLKGLPRRMLNTRQQSTGPRMHKQNRLALPTRSTRASNPMYIRLTTTRQIKIDHMTHPRHVQPASCHVSGYNHIQLATTQLLNNPFPLRLSNIAMQRRSTMTLTAQILRQRLSRTLQLHKHNHRINRLCLQNSGQCRFTMMIRHHDIPLANRVCRRRSLHNRHFRRIPLI
jgi:hypothetical protein